MERQSAVSSCLAGIVWRFSPRLSERNEHFVAVHRLPGCCPLYGIGVEPMVLNATLNLGPDRAFIGVVDSGAELKTPTYSSGFGATVELDVRGLDFWISRERVAHEVVGFD